MKIKHTFNNFNYEFEIKSDAIDIVFRTTATTYNGWEHPIKNGKIVWYDASTEFLDLTPEIIQFAEKLVKNRVFV
jgi:hypothetical protein